MVKVFAARRRISLALGVTLSLAIVGGAFAYWTINGSGSGSAATGDVTAVTVNQTSTISGLYPGGPAQLLAGNFTNPNAGPVKLGDVTVVVSSTWSAQADALKPACTAADFAISGSAPVNAEVVNGTGVGAWSGLYIQLTNRSTNQDNCKNLNSIPLIYTVTAAQ